MPSPYRYLVKIKKASGAYLLLFLIIEKTFVDQYSPLILDLN